MASTATITGNLGRIGEKRQTGNGTSVVDFSVAENMRRFNKETNSWEDGETIWYNLTAWGRWADSITATDANGNPYIPNGTPLLILARYTNKPGYTNKDGVEVPARNHLTVENMGPSIQWNPAMLIRDGKAASAPSTANNPAPAKKAVPKPAPVKKAPADDFDDLFGDDEDGDDDFLI